MLEGGLDSHVGGIFEKFKSASVHSIEDFFFCKGQYFLALAKGRSNFELVEEDIVTYGY